MRKHLLVTNDFPPKIGGIQSYLWELWRRLPPDGVTVLTSPHRSSDDFDDKQSFRIERVTEPVLLPQPWLASRITRLAREVGAELVVLDPALPLGLVGPHLDLPYAVVLHGAEVTVPGRLPGLHQLLARVLRRAVLVIAAGGYPAVEAERAAGTALPTLVIPPGVDTERFRPLDPDRRLRARLRLGLTGTGLLVVSVSRLVPRKGFDVVIEAVARLTDEHPGLTLAIAGSGRDRTRLQRIARDRAAPVRFCGRTRDDDLPDLYGCADVFAALVRSRWGGLEQEGFGIVFVEAAACGVPQLAGRSGGAHEAVADGVTGLVVDDPRDLDQCAAALGRLLADDELRRTMGEAARRRAVAEFSYDVLAERLQSALA